MVKRTNTALDVLLESRFDDYWNVAGRRDLSELWTSFSQFTKPKEKLADGSAWSWERLTKKSSNIKARLFVASDFGSGMSKAALRRENRQWAVEKPKLDTARKLRAFISSIWKTQSSKKP